MIRTLFVFFMIPSGLIHTTREDAEWIHVSAAGGYLGEIVVAGFDGHHALTFELRGRAMALNVVHDGCVDARRLRRSHPAVRR